MHVVTIVLHTDEDKETSALLICQSCNVTYSIQFRRELAAMHYVTLLGTAGEMRSNGYLIAVHSFQRPTLYYDWRKTLDDVTNCNFQHPDMWGRISLLIGWLEKESVVKIYIPWKVTRSWPFRDIGPYGHTGHKPYMICYKSVRSETCNLHYIIFLWSESLAASNYLATTLLKCFHEDVNSKMNSANICYHYFRIRYLPLCHWNV